jgi:site-specific recombinase XerD
MSEVLLTNAIAGFLDSLQAAKKSDNTVSAYRRDLEAVAELLVGPVDKPVAEMSLADMTVAALRQAFGVRASVSAAATVARTHSVWTRAGTRQLCRRS